MKTIIKAKTVATAYKKHKNKLSFREKDILIRYYGLNNQVRHSLQELGEIYKITRERIRQIKVIALTKIKVNPWI